MGCVRRGSHYLLDAFAELRKVLSFDAMWVGLSFFIPWRLRLRLAFLSGSMEPNLSRPFCWRQFIA